MKNLYTAHVAVSSGRDGEAKSADGHLSTRLALPKELGGPGNAANPEQLFAAGYAACFLSSLKAAASSLKSPIQLKSIDAQAVLSVRDDGSYVVSDVSLHIHADGLDASTDAVLAEAKRICAYSNATRGLLTLNAAFV
jgi:Ohr subfamily peroxiredoxin